MHKTNPVIDDQGNTHWFSNGLLHRVNGPAREYACGTRCWYQHGELHRVGGPAIEYANGGWVWMKHGLGHRLDGPAMKHANGDTFWYIDAVNYTEEQFRLFLFVNSKVDV